MRFRDLLKLDASITEKIQIAEKPGTLRSAAMIFAHSGDSWFWIAATILLWFFGNQVWKYRSLVIGASIFLTAVLVLVIKFSVKRERPEGEWGRMYRSTDPHSFPSGHAARAFMLAVIMIGLGPAWLAAVLVIWAPLVSTARVAMGVHYLSDVITGALLGILMGCANLFVIPSVLGYLPPLI